MQPGSASDRGLQQWPDRAPATDPKVPVKALKGYCSGQLPYVERHSLSDGVVVLIFNITLTLFLKKSMFQGKSRINGTCSKFTVNVVINLVKYKVVISFHQVSLEGFMNNFEEF